jgi:CP family cyanate transporter-like MFS transporter
MPNSGKPEFGWGGEHTEYAALTRFNYEPTFFSSEQRAADAAAGSAMREVWIAGGLLWLAGVALRLSILAVPPVIALIQSDLRLSGTEVGILSGLPMILFAMAALPGSLFIARLGALPTLVAGLLIAGVASALRGAIRDVLALFAATVVMSAGIAIMQPALPPLVRQWLPRHVGLGTALFTNGLLVGETLPVMVTIPFVLPLVDGSWRGALAIWALPLVLIALVTAVLAPAPKQSAPSAQAPERNWWPDWRNPLTWQIGILLGSVNGVYFAANTFLPGYLTHAGRPDLIGAALTALNFGQLPASFALLATVDRFVRRPLPFMLCGVLFLVCLAGMVTTASAWTVVCAGVLGFVGAVVFTLALALPPLLSAPADVARVSAAVFTVSYSQALLACVLSGAAWDLGGSPRFTFLPMVINSLPLLVLPPLMRFRRSQPTS